MNNLMKNFNMSNEPFTNSISIDFVMKSEAFTDSLERLKYAVKNNLFLILSSPPGCGKSTLLRSLRESMDPNKTLFLYVSESQLSPRWLYNILLRQLGEREYLNRGDGKRALHEKFAVIKEMEKKNIAIVIDEGHLLKLDTLQEIRFFLNNNIDSSNPVSLILSGQNELLLTLRRTSFEAIRQRINIKVELHPLDDNGTKTYILSHLKYSGTDISEIFTEEAIETISTESGGVMRVINQICYNALITAASLGLKTIDKSIIDNVCNTELIK